LLLTSYFIAHVLYRVARGVELGFRDFWMYIIFAVVFLLSMVMFRMYNITTFFYLDRVVQRMVVSTVVASSCVSSVVFLAKEVSASRLFFLLFAVLSFLLTFFFRMLTIWMRHQHIGNGYSHVLFIGDEEVCRQYEAFVAKTSLRIRIERRLAPDDPALSSDGQFEKLLISMNVDEVLAVHGMDGAPNARTLIRVCEDMGITMRLLLDIYDLPTSNHYVSSIGTYPLLTYHSTSMDKVQLFFKSAMDLVGAAVGLILLSPVFLAAAVAIKLESPGPVFFVQTRVGLNGKDFKMYKFRSMCRDADSQKVALLSQNKIGGNLMFKMDDDPRITRVGRFIRKTSIDELPQLINVLKRDMSLVGTRPPTKDEVEHYERKHRRRISIMPGITGMWQVNGRSDIVDFEQVVALDKQYIDQWSLLLDIKLIFKTVFAVFSRHGAS
jgi:exopolysaccharide biosynthesis polyprenyl glycosylphosphotransferase